MQSRPLPQPRSHAIWSVRNGEAENAPLRRALSDLILGELIFAPGIPITSPSRLRTDSPRAVLFDIRVQ